jgi:hypothetical protein
MAISRTTYASLFLLGLLWFLFLVVQYLNVYFELFWYFWWLDIVMHAYGGSLIVTSWFIVKALGAFPRLVGGYDRRSLLVLILVIFGWELYEYQFGLITPVGYVLDTAMDLAIGFGGGLASYLIFRSRTIERNV